MATAKKLKSGSWRCLVYSHTEETIQKDGTIKKKRIYKSFTSDIPGPKGKREAEQMAAEYAYNKEHLIKTVSMTLDQAVTSYIESKKNVLSESTITGYKSIQRNYMPPIAHVDINQFTKVIVQKWVNDMSAKASVKTVKNAYGLFSATMAMFTNLQFKIKFPQKKQSEIYIPSDADIKLLLQHAEGDFKLALYLGAFAGLRRGEICALERSDVHKGYITINKSMGLTQDRHWKIKPPKTECSNRNVNIPDFLFKLLKNKKGRLVDMTPDQVTDHFCVLRDSLDMKKFRFHDLRHYYVSVNHALGVPDQYIMAMGGWRTDRTMKAVYRNILIPEKDKFAKISLDHFESMQHEMQHNIKKVP